MAGSPGLAYKAYEIEELVDVYFYRRAGFGVAVAARAARLSPNLVSLLAAAIGVAGGALLYDNRLAVLGWGLLVLHGVFDSADGQLARLTSRTSELGRILDGVAGYATHIAILAALLFRASGRGAGADAWIWIGLTGLSIAVHAQLYEYHRVSYQKVAIEGRLPAGGTAARAAADRTAGAAPSAWAAVLYRAALAYESIQSRLAGLHPRVEQAVAARAPGGRVSEEDRVRYRSSFYRIVRGWNALGDNGRRYALGILVLMGQVDWFVPFILGPMNLVAVSLAAWQRRADRRFLAT